MEKFSNFICKNKNIILIVTLFLAIISFVMMEMTKVNYDILVYLPSDIETIEGQNILTDEFNTGSYSIVVIDNASKKDILNVEEKIKEIEGVNKVVSLYDVIGDIPVEMLPEEIGSKLHNDDTDLLLVTFDSSTSSIETLDAVEEIRNINDISMIQGGMSSMVLDTMNLSESEIVIYIIIAVIFCLIVLELALDSYVIPFILLLNIGCAILFNMGTNLFLGSISYITKALVAVLQLGVTMDFSIFLYHSYEDKKNKKDKDKAMKEAIKDTFVSVIGSSLTTIVGFLVLCTMNLTLGKDLGIVMAKGVLLGVVSVLTIFPSLLLTFDNIIEKTKHKKIMPKFEWLNKFVVKNYILIFVLFIVLIVPFYLANNKVEVYYKLDRSLPETLESIKANKILEEKYNIVSPEILLVSKDMKTSDLNEMVEKISNLDGIDFVLSTSKLSELGISTNMLSEDVTSIIENDEYQLILINSTYEVASDSLNNQIDEVNEIIKEYDENSILAGEGPLMKDLVTICDVDFNNVNTSSILCIFIVLFIVLKSLSLPFLLISSIEFAIFINMGISYLGGSVLPFIAPIVLGTIQLGATIDYAILVTTNYLEKRRKGIEKKQAMLDTLNYCGTSIFVSGMCFFAATFGVGIYSKIEMIGSLCNLISRGALISMFVAITVLPSVLLVFDGLILKTTKKGKINMKNKNVKSKNVKTRSKAKKVVAALLALSVFAPYNVSAMSKDEVVYTKLNADGSVKNTIVNEKISNISSTDSFEDYTELENILNISDNSTFTLNNNVATWNPLGNNLTYQGTTSSELPISVSIKYYLDGVETNVDDMLGKKGNVKIVLNYSNKDSHISLVNGHYETLYTPFVVTMGTMIDGNNNSNITVTNGKVVSNGSNEVVVALSTPGLYESLKIDELKNSNSITITYDTEEFSLPTMYSVITPKAISSSDLTFLNNIDTLSSKVNTLQESTNTIDDGAKKLSEATTYLKETLKSSTSNLSTELTEEEETAITTQVSSAIDSKFTDEYKSAIATNAWTQVQESLSNSTDTTVTDNGQTAVINILATYLGGQENLVSFEKCSKGDTTSCGKLIAQGYDLTTVTNFYNTLVSNVNSSITNSVMYVAENVSKSVATSTAYEASKQAALESSVSTASLVKKTSVEKTQESLTTLYEGVSKIDENMNLLSEGITKLNNEGIKTISNLVNTDVKNTTDRIKKLTELGENYNSFAGSNMSGETKMIMVVNGKKYQSEKEVETTATTKTNIFTRIKNIFKKAE